MKILIINPNLVCNSKDKFTTGIIYLPIAIASVSAVLKKFNIQYKIIDLFGSKPEKLKKEENFLILGEEIFNFKNDINNCDAIFIYANQVINHISVIKIRNQIRNYNKKIKIFTFENTQAVTAYSLREIYNEFVYDENDFVLIGEPEYKIRDICLNLNKFSELKQINGLLGKNFQNFKREIIDDLNALPFPDWKPIPLNNYWKIKHAHGPLSSNKYVSILTSRGCPYPCKFCIIPETNDRKWRSRSAKNVVDEIETLVKEYNITEFHIEDVNPTINEKRTIEFCNEIIKRKLKINWKIVAGTKVESIKKEETINMMAESGCKYIAIAPESGSRRIMKAIGKPFNIDHAYKIVKQMNKNKIFSQAVFVFGFPGETKEDLVLTKKMIFGLTRNGVDEIAIFIVTPIPGSEIFKSFTGYKNYSELNFSPIWRLDYKYLSRKRLMYYSYFIFFKIIFFPRKVIKQIYNFFTKKFETKMEMVPYKYLKLKYTSLFK